MTKPALSTKSYHEVLVHALDIVCCDGLMGCCISFTAATLSNYQMALSIGVAEFLFVLGRQHGADLYAHAESAGRSPSVLLHCKWSCCALAVASLPPPSGLFCNRS